VLAPEMTRERFEDAAHAFGWMLYTVVEESDEHPYEEVWALNGGTSAVHYYEDETLSTAFLLVMGDGERELAHEIVHRWPTIQAAGAVALARAAGSSEERIRAAGYLASTAPPASRPDVVDAFDELLSADDPAVRRFVLEAASYPAWPQLRPLVERVAASDPEPAVRTAAQQVLPDFG